MFWYVILGFIIISIVYSRSKMTVDKLNIEFENNACTVVVKGICTDKSIKYGVDGKYYSTIWEYKYNNEVCYSEFICNSEKYFSNIDEISELKINPFNFNEVIKVVSDEDNKREKQIRMKNKIVSVICLLVGILLIISTIL